MAAGLVKAAEARGVFIVAAPDDAIASAAPTRWAAGELERSLTERGVPVRRVEKVAQAGAGDLCIVAAGPANPLARAALPQAAEALALAPATSDGRAVLIACGSDVRGLVYALLELADRVRYAAEPLSALEVRQAVAERPANKIRSITRCFVSDVEDKPWFSDRAMWGQYLSMLAAHRFNRFSLAFGIGYDFPSHVSDVYFYFAYPFLVSVPGYDVRAAGLPEAERDRNLETLRFISDETAARGLHFQLALWTHAYEWIDSPKANYLIQGLTPRNHADYCRDALLALLRACPAIGGVTFRVHGESGVPEQSYTFWQTVFDGIVRCGRKVEIDMHAKGMDRKMIDVALGTGMLVNISPKYWAEHMGLPYHQAAIRELEMPPRDRKVEGTFALSSGSRRFLRYGYGDLLEEERSYGVLHRIWPGTRRVLLWGDPVQAGAYGRASSFCGSAGVELCEPLSFKGRTGSGVPGGRCSYSEASLNSRYDWEKFLYTYRVWGRLIYNPEANPESWRRFLRKEFRAAAGDTEAALASASRVLPLVTTAHGVSGANRSYWPEIYTNMPIVDEAKNRVYGDTPSPRRFGTVSPFDPQLFSRVDDFAQELLAGERSGKYSPLDVARWLEKFSDTAAKRLTQAEKQAGGGTDPAFRRMSVDVSIQSGLGRFFAWKLRSGVLWALYSGSGNRTALEEAIKAYRAARDAWVELAGHAKSVYMTDITYGSGRHMRGDWLDRLAAIDDDIADMEKRLAQATSDDAPPRVRQAIREVLSSPERRSVPCRHTPATEFLPGRPHEVALSLEKSAGRSARLYYRHVNQAELWRSEEMQWRENSYRAAIPAEYTASPYPLQYYFELRDEPDNAWLYPGFGPELSNQPYFVMRHHPVRR
jgi:hypothetical protein